MVVKEFRTAADFWKGMVEPDYQDALADPADLRAALHAAISLFHLCDWVWHSHEKPVRDNFSFWDDATQRNLAVHNDKSFANSLESCEDFGRIRGIAHASKHLKLKDIRPVPNAPRHATNTAVRQEGDPSGGWGVGDFAYDVAGAYAGPLRVTLEGPPDLEFRDIAQAVHDMWSKLAAQYGWW